MSSFLCLALFGRLSLLSIPIAMIWSHFFIVAYLCGLLAQFFPSALLYSVNSVYWTGLARVYEYLKDYDYVLRFYGFRESQDHNQEFAADSNPRQFQPYHRTAKHWKSNS